MNHAFSKQFGSLPYYAPGEALYSDGLGPFPEDDEGNKYIIVNVSSGDHWVTLHAVKGLDAKSTAFCLLKEFASTGCPRIFWSDQGSNYTSSVIQEFCRFFEIEQKFSLPYRPLGNSIVERSHRETKRHLQAIMLGRNIKENWSTYLPIVQWVLNSSYLHAVGSSAMRLRYGDSMDAGRGIRNARRELATSEELVEEINRQLFDVISISAKHSERERPDAVGVPLRLDDVEVGDYVLVKYPNGSPSKLHSPFRGPMSVLRKIRDEGLECVDIITQQTIQVSNDRVKKFIFPPGFDEADVAKLAAADQGQFMVEAIIRHRKVRSSYEFFVKWLGYEDTENTWEPYRNVRKLALMADYLAQHPDIRRPH
jgi:hypothetical protein